MSVSNAEYADCDGEYKQTSGVRVNWAPERTVYKHTDKDRSHSYLYRM